MAEEQPSGLFAIFMLTIYSLILIPYTLYRLCSSADEKAEAVVKVRPPDASCCCALRGARWVGKRSRTPEPWHPTGKQLYSIPCHAAVKEEGIRMADAGVQSIHKGWAPLSRPWSAEGGLSPGYRQGAASAYDAAAGASGGERRCQGCWRMRACWTTLDRRWPPLSNARASLSPPPGRTLPCRHAAHAAGMGRVGADAFLRQGGQL
jgi:hypothetical protein